MTEFIEDLDEEVEEIDDDEDEDQSTVVPERPRSKWDKRSICPGGTTGHHPIPNPKKRGPYDHEYVCEYCGKHNWTPKELEELIADVLLREDANRELCRVCHEEDRDTLPYGDETGHVEWKPQYDKEGEPVLDEEGNLLYVAYPELMCQRGHRWYLGEGPRRNINGPNSILFETHLYNRKKRELLAAEGVVDPAYTMDRWGKRPTVGNYNRSHPLGRPVNDPEKRRSSGSGFYA